MVDPGPVMSIQSQLQGRRETSQILNFTAHFNDTSVADPVCVYQQVYVQYGVVTLNVTVKTRIVKTSVPNVQFPNICRGKVTPAVVSDTFYM